MKSQVFCEAQHEPNGKVISKSSQTKNIDRSNKFRQYLQPPLIPAFNGLVTSEPNVYIKRRPINTSHSLV